MIAYMKRMMKQNNREMRWIVLFAFFVAAAFLTVCSRSSFMYPCNNWDDANSYFSMGKSMMNGKVIYRDLYDQKGPYLYLLYGIAYLISPDSFIGVFLLEIVAIALFLLAGYRIMALYCQKSTALLLIPVLAAVCLSAKSFYWGGAAEEFCLPLFGWSLYHSLYYFKEEYPKPPDLKIILLNGVFAGIILQVKYTMLGFYFIWLGFIAIMNFTRANWRKALAACMLFLGGMLATLIPWLVYFGIHGALDDWYRCYVYNNIFLYSDLGKSAEGIGEKVYTLAKILYYLIIDNASYFIPIILGMTALLFSRKSRWYEKINLYALFLFLFLGIFIGGANLPYYSMPLMVFSTVGLGFVGALADRWVRRGYIIAFPIVFFLSLAGAWTNSMNPPFMQQSKEDFFLFKFKEIVSQEENPTLLNYNCLDAGLYTVADIMPTCEYFQTNGIALKEMEKAQLNYIAEGATQFILVRGDYPQIIEQHYRMVGKETNTWGNVETVYYLFKRME